MGLRPIPGTEVPGYDIAPIKGAVGVKQEELKQYVLFFFFMPRRCVAGVKQDV